MRKVQLLLGLCVLASFWLQGEGTYWTSWFDRDNPGGEGDFEVLIHLGNVCGEHGDPTDIECRRTTDQLDYSLTGDVLENPCQLPEGLACWNKHQPRGQMCSDYEVRFLCDETTQITTTPVLTTTAPDPDNSDKSTCHNHCPDPKHIFCSVSENYQCKGNTDCPKGKNCCPTSCKTDVCVKAVECCCPELDYSVDNSSKPCRDDCDCDIRTEKCCWAGQEYNYTLQCRPSVACPCTQTQDDLCCAHDYTDIVKPIPTCQFCDDNSPCPASMVCCLGSNGCSYCQKGYLNTCDGETKGVMKEPASPLQVVNPEEYEGTLS